MRPGQIKNLYVPNDYTAGRIWGRTNCTIDQIGMFRCETGDCGPNVECAWDSIQRGAQPPATLAEFTLNGWGDKDYYDVSLVDGYNVQMSIIPKSPNSDEFDQYWCTSPTCDKDLNSICPEELKKKIQEEKSLLVYRLVKNSTLINTAAEMLSVLLKHANHPTGLLIIQLYLRKPVQLLIAMLTMT